eukprot:CAMPEP_0182596890 /NCGR_PEP_ID=MMETSP1324-20130603/85143_1 /TAXON_ID=236786 /ORGANISM="Florenciella sp., Strain RCC1587" /LENGTH=55 /DNA_ID=CAMNT_0024814603 /DNA_START=69 /DNA_END=233 /DNA_ORIENTATION=-
MTPFGLLKQHRNLFDAPLSLRGGLEYVEQRLVCAVHHINPAARVREAQCPHSTLY